MASFIEVSVGFMSSIPAVGHLEFVVHYSTEIVPSQQEVLVAITANVLRELGGQQTDWNITSHDTSAIENDFEGNVFTYKYSFDWLHLDTKARMCPVMRTVTFRPHRHRFEINI